MKSFADYIPDWLITASIATIIVALLLMWLLWGYTIAREMLKGTGEPAVSRKFPG